MDRQRSLSTRKTGGYEPEVATFPGQIKDCAFSAADETKRPTVKLINSRVRRCGLVGRCSYQGRSRWIIDFVHLMRTDISRSDQRDREVEGEVGNRKSFGREGNFGRFE